MAAASTLSTVAFIYKRLYADKVGDSALRKHALFSKIRKEGGFGGTAFYYPIKTGNPQGISTTMAGAISGISSTKGSQLAASRKAKYAVITLDGEAMAASKSDSGAFLKLVQHETDSIIEEFIDTLAFDLFRDSSGVRGAHGGISTNVVTLATPDDARNFKIGMALASGPNADGTSLNTHTGTITVTAVDEDNGKITVSSAANMGAFTTAHYLFRLGDTGNVCVEGLASHFPLTAPTAGDSFRGIDRSVDVARLAGSRLNDTSSTIEENLGTLAVKISQRGKRADVAVLNPVKFWEVVRRQNTKVVLDGGGGNATYGFESIKLATPAGVLDVYSDADCPVNRGYVLNMSTLYLKHLEALPHIVQDDGRTSLRVTAEDSIEARVRCWWNLICTDPASNGVCSIG